MKFQLTIIAAAFAAGYFSSSSHWTDGFLVGLAVLTSAAVVQIARSLES